MNVHPPLTVFPSALLMALLVLELVHTFRPFGPEGRRVILCILTMAVLGVVAAFFSGYQANELANQTFRIDDATIALHHSLGRWLLLLSIPLGGLGITAEIATHGKQVFRGLYLLCLCGAAGLVLATGYLGGELVFKHGAGVYAVPQAKNLP